MFNQQRISIAGCPLTFTQFSAGVVVAPPNPCLLLGSSAQLFFLSACLKDYVVMEGVALIDRQRQADHLHELQLRIIIIIIVSMMQKFSLEAARMTSSTCAAFKCLWKAEETIVIIIISVVVAIVEVVVVIVKVLSFCCLDSLSRCYRIRFPPCVNDCVRCSWSPHPHPVKALEVKHCRMWCCIIRHPNMLLLLTCYLLLCHVEVRWLNEPCLSHVGTRMRRLWQTAG